MRALTPSPSSAFICLMVAALFVVSGVILSSVNYGTALPGVLEGQWAITYTQYVVQPLTNIFTNASFNKSFVAVMWGIIGLIGYVAFEYGIRTWRSVKQARHDVAVQQGTVLMSPTQRDNNRAILWRIVMIVAAIVFLIAMQPLLRHATGAPTQFIKSQDLGADGLRLFFAVLEWALFWHGMVAFLRLYSMRTRMFGDDKLY